MTGVIGNRLYNGTYGDIYLSIDRESVVKKSPIKTVAKRSLLNSDFWLRYLHMDVRSVDSIIRRIQVLKIDSSVGLQLEFMPYNLRQYEALHEKGLDLDVIQKIAGKLVKALCFLDEKDVVYVNLNPENILLSTNGSQVKLSNFEQSFFKQCNNFISRVKVNFTYASPRIILDDFSGLNQAPVWSLAIITYELFTKNVFARSRSEVMRWHENLVGSRYTVSLFEQGSDEALDQYCRLEPFFIPVEPAQDHVLIQANSKGESPKKNENLNSFLGKVFSFYLEPSIHEVAQERFFESFHIENLPQEKPRYKLSTKSKPRILGEGAFGKVIEYSIEEEKTKEITRVALKKIEHFEELKLVQMGSDLACLNSTLHEYSILRFLSQDSRSKNVFVTCLNILRFNEKDALVYECMDMDLYMYIKSQKFRLSSERIKTITRQILEGLVVLYDFKIMHSDLKFENILVSETVNGLVFKISDFGFANFEDDAWVLNGHVCTRMYRAPEIVIKKMPKMASDVWSLGVIVAEMILGKQIFPCETKEELISMQRSCLGEIYSQELQSLIGKKSMRLYPKIKGKTYLFDEDKIKSSDLGLIVEGCLKFHPEQRLKPYELLERIGN